jgi:hypothetical protein
VSKNTDSSWHAYDAIIFSDEKLFLLQPAERPDLSVSSMDMDISREK